MKMEEVKRDGRIRVPCCAIVIVLNVTEGKMLIQVWISRFLKILRQLQYEFPIICKSRFFMEPRIVLVGKFLQIKSTHYSHRALCGLCNKFAFFQLNFLFHIASSKFNRPHIFCSCNILASFFRLTQDFDFFRNEEKRAPHSWCRRLEFKI